jgi:hypothetical protein
MSVVEQKKERIRSALEELDHPTCIELGFPKSGPTLLYEGNKAAINRDLVLNALGTSISITSRSKNGDSAATSSLHISLVSSTQRTLRPSHSSVGF